MKNFIKLNQNILLAIISYLAFVFIISALHFRIDMTEGNLYTLSDGSKQIVDSIDEELTIKYFFSKSNKSLPLQIKSYGKRVEELLQEFADESSHLTLEVYDPKPDSDEEVMAAQYGVSGVQVADGDSFYMGAAILYLDEVYQIPFFDPRRQKFLEYEIASLLAKVGQKERQTIGLMAGFDTQDAPPQMMGQPTEDNWLFRKELENLYEVQMLEQELEEVPASIDILIVAHPVGLSDKTEYAIEQFILGGGKTLLLVDPSPYSLQSGGGSDLPKVFRTLGLIYDSSKVVADEKNATMVNTARGQIRLPVWLSFGGGEGFTNKSIATSDLQSGLFIEAGHFTMFPGSKTSFDPLIQTSSQSGIVASFMARSVTEGFGMLKEKNEPLTIAGLARGKFTSAFNKKPEGSNYSRSHLDNAEKEVSVLVVADIDFLNNQFALNTHNFFGRTIIQPKNHNIAFLVNAVEVIAGRPELISVRSRGDFTRPFTTVQNLEQKAQKRWLGVEKELSQKIQNLQSKLNELQQAKTDDNQVILSEVQKEEIRKFKLEQVAAKKERREVRKQLRQEIESLGSVISGLNIAVIPLLVLGTGLLIYSRRSKGLPVIKKGASHDQK